MPLECYFENEFYPLDTPLLKTNDLGLLRGYGMFDYLRSYNGIPFRFDDYWERFSRSAESLGLEIPVGKDDALDILLQLYRRSGEAEIAFRLILTGGFSPDGLSVIKPNFLVRAESLPVDNPAGRNKGIKVLPYEYVRDLPYVKTTSYLHMMLMNSTMKKEDASDLLFHKDGLISELTRSNLFIVNGSTIATPATNALKGITRKLVIEKASGIFNVLQRDISLTELLEADEVFTTSTTKGVMPVVAVGDRKIGGGIPGSVALKLQSLLEEVFLHYGKE